MRRRDRLVDSLIGTGLGLLTITYAAAWVVVPLLIVRAIL